MPDLVPIIDLSGWHSGDPARRAAVAAAVDDACRNVGFLQITGHGVPPETVQAMLEATDAFFSLPLSEKLAWKPPSPQVNRGYTAVGTEGLAFSLGMEAPPDLFEAFNIGPEDPVLSHPYVAAERERVFAPNLWPDEPASLKPALVGYFAQARRVAHLLTDVFAAALGLPEGFFAPYTDHSTDVMRVNHYERLGDTPLAEGQMRMGAHTDYGIVTVLYAQPGLPSLQLLSVDGEWHDVIPAEGAFLVNLGDLTAQWTNDRWRSTLHRVVPPVGKAYESFGGAVKRRSVAFFHDGNGDARIECLPTCTDADNPPKYPPVVAGEHIMAKLLGPRTMSQSEATNTAADRLPPS
jgi:isopenicillin N synthase-like dioxygenase